MNITAKNKVLLIFASLMGLTLFAFQNCSSSLFVFSSANLSKAEDLSDMINESELEVKKSKKELEAVSAPSKIVIRRPQLANEVKDKAVDPDTETAAEKFAKKLKVPKQKVKKKIKKKKSTHQIK